MTKIEKRLRQRGYEVTINKNKTVTASNGRTIIEGQTLTEIWQKMRRFGNKQPSFYAKDLSRETERLRQLAEFEKKYLVD